MKFKNITLSMLAVGAFALTSCSPGQYWDEPSLSSDALAFANPSQVTLIPAEGAFPSTCTVTVSRSNADTELIVPLFEGAVKTPTDAEKDLLQPGQVLIKVVGQTDPVAVTPPVILFSQKSTELSLTQTEVKFAKGSYTADINLNVDTELVEPGFDYEANFSLVLPDDVNITENSANKKCSFTIRQAVILKWEDAGTASLTSAIMGNKEPIEVKVEVASNYPDKKYALYRLVSPYHAIDPEIPEGYDIQFLCSKGSFRKAYKPLEGWQETGLKVMNAEGYEEFVYLGNTKEYAGSFNNQSKRYILTEAVGLNTLTDATTAQPEDDENPEMETLSFTWNF
ncbi:MAG: hypothetical protein K2G67_02670 [Muribaculaceae bacterium]|nr:hypothetical protein [Muribaculaceae bacterium]